MDTLSTTQVAAMLRTSHDTVTRLIRIKKLKAERLTPNSPYRIDAQSVIDYASRNGITLSQQPDR